MASQTRVTIAVAILSVWIHLPYLDAVSATMAKTAAAFVVAPSTDSTPITFATISPGANASCNSTNATRTACFTGDPHFTTFDGYYYDYNGDCPFIFSQPCGNLSCGFANFSVRAKNRLLYVGAGISVVAEIEVTFYDTVLHVDQQGILYVNGAIQLYPYFYPNSTNAKRFGWVVSSGKCIGRLQVTVFLSSGGRILIRNDQGVSVVLQGSSVCLTVPDNSAFYGNGTMCGLAGNIDNNPHNDFYLPNNTYLVQPTVPYDPPTQAFGDQWITTDFLNLDPNGTACLPALQLPALHACNSTLGTTSCAPVLDAIVGKGVFAQCAAAMGNASLVSFHKLCVFDVCNNVNYCELLNEFARRCQRALKDVPLGNAWRASTNCPPFSCPANAQYSTCASQCPMTCAALKANATMPSCNSAECIEGCVCNPSYIADTTTGNLACVLETQCDVCVDKAGNTYPADSQWMNNKCTECNSCLAGNFKSTACSCAAGTTCKLVAYKYACA